MGDEDEFRETFFAAARDEGSRGAREEVGRALVTAFRETGNWLWVTGYMIGGDRANGRSPFGFGNDAAVGLATVAQVAGELCGGIVVLLESGNSYAAHALLRQLVEAEYLLWAFAEDEREAAQWMRSSKEERMKMWQPRHIRDRAAGRFRSADYGMHCELGGHPTPSAKELLPNHEQRPISVAWLELARHGTSAWRYLLAAMQRFEFKNSSGYADLASLQHAIDRWNAEDKLQHLVVAQRLHSDPSD